MWSELLVRLVPGVFADPDRPRRCGNCRLPVTRENRAGPDEPGWFCSDRCRLEHWTDTNS